MGRNPLPYHQNSQWVLYSISRGHPLIDDRILESHPCDIRGVMLTSTTLKTSSEDAPENDSAMPTI